MILEVGGPIGPATSEYVLQGLASAQARNATAVILRLDTPGGLDSAMREIVQGILGSPVPVVGYVAPAGARAASAGTYILYASHVAAMAPATNLGAATPVRLGGPPGLPGGEDSPTTPEGPGGEEPAGEEQAPEPATAMDRKMVNDARAYLRSLAQLRGRSVEWAEEAVAQGASLTAVEALERGVIDLVARDLAELLDGLAGRVVQTSAGEKVLETSELAVETLAPDWRHRMLAAITNPQVAYILMLLGIYGLFFELSNPGFGLPGVLGGICLLVALFAFQALPVNYAGLALILLGLGFMVAEAFVPSFGVLGLGGVVAFVVGSLILWEEGGPGYGVPLGLVMGLALVSAALLIGLGTLFLRRRRAPVVSGAEELLDAVAVSLDSFSGAGRVRVHGEVWQAHSQGPVTAGQPLRITGRDGLVLEVRPLREEDGR